MSYSVLQEAHITYLTNSHGTVDSTGHATPPRTPVLQSSHIFSSPISKLINFKKKSSNASTSSISSSTTASPQTYWSNNATPKKITRLTDNYIFGSPKPAQKTLPQKQSVREKLYIKADPSIYSTQQQMFHPSPKRPPPPRPIADGISKENLSLSNDFAKTQTANTNINKEGQNGMPKKRYVNEECCLCFEKLSTRSKNEKVFSAKCGHVVHEDCLLLFIENTVRTENDTNGEMQRGNLFPLCIKCTETNKSNRCIPIDSSFQDNLLSRLLLNSKEYDTNDKHESHPSTMQNTFVQSVPPLSLVPQKKYTSVISPIVQGQYPQYLSRYSSQKSKKSLNALNSPKPITRKVAATTPTLVSSRIRTSAAFVNVKKHATVTSTVVGFNTILNTANEQYEEEHEDEELEIIHIDDLHQLHQLHELHELQQPAESVRQVVVRKVKVPPKSLVIVLQLDTHKKIKFAENVSIVNSLKALDIWYGYMNSKEQKSSFQYDNDGVPWSVKLCCIDETGKVLSSGQISDVLKQLGSTPGLQFSQIRGKMLTSDYWDQTLIQRYYQDSDTPIEVCIISNCVVFNSTDILSNPSTNTKTNIMMWNNFFTLTKETLCKIHIGYLNEDVGDELIEINNWTEIMELLCVYYGFEFGQDFEDL